MKFDEIDKNFSFESTIGKEGLVWHDARRSPFEIYGLHEPKNAALPFHRMPIDIADKVSQNVRILNYHTAGGRLAFSTNSPYIAIRCETSEKIFPIVTHMSLSGSQGFDLYRASDDGILTYRSSLLPPLSRVGEIGFETVKDLPKDGKIYHYVLNFPLYATVKNLAIGLHRDAALLEYKPYKYEKPIVFYGSSITQGGCASRPGACYQALLSAELGFDYINLGFSAGAKGEDLMIDHLTSLDPLIFVSDYDHNAPSPDHLRTTLSKLYHTFREKHPDTPFIFMSAPGLNTDRGEERRAVIEEIARAAQGSGDQNAYFADGAPMFDEMKPHACTVDGLHPTDLGFFGMYRSLAPLFDKLLRATK